IEPASFAFGIRVLSGCSAMRAKRRSNNLSISLFRSDCGSAIGMATMMSSRPVTAVTRTVISFPFRSSGLRVGVALSHGSMVSAHQIPALHENGEQLSLIAVVHARLYTLFSLGPLNVC